MIRCKLDIRRGLLTRIESTGHAPVRKTWLTRKSARISIACAAVSTLIRSLGMLLEKSEFIVIDVETFEPGDVKLKVGQVDESAEDWLRGLTDMLIQGLEDVKRDFPDQIELERT